MSNHTHIAFEGEGEAREKSSVNDILEYARGGMAEQWIKKLQGARVYVDCFLLTARAHMLWLVSKGMSGLVTYRTPPNTQ